MAAASIFASGKLRMDAAAFWLTNETPRCAETKCGDSWASHRTSNKSRGGLFPTTIQSSSADYSKRHPVALRPLLFHELPPRLRVGTVHPAVFCRQTNEVHADVDGGGAARNVYR